MFGQRFKNGIGEDYYYRINSLPINQSFMLEVLKFSSL